MIRTSSSNSLDNSCMAIFRQTEEFQASLTSNEENLRSELLIHKILDDEIRSHKAKSALQSTDEPYHNYNH